MDSGLAPYGAPRNDGGEIGATRPGHALAVGHGASKDAYRMLFSSPTFIAFFVVYFCFHLIVPRQYRLYLIICGSTIFYAWWKVAYAWLPYLLMAIAYCGMQWMERADDPLARKRRMITTVVVLFAPLAV